MLEAFEELSKENLLQHEIDLWAKYEGEEYPDVFSFLELAKDGGFSEVKDLYVWTRWGSAGALVLFVSYNVISVVILDLGFIRDPDEVVSSLGGDAKMINDSFYFSRAFVPPVVSFLSRIVGHELSTPEPVQVLGVLELMLIAFILLDCLMCAVQIVLCRDRKRWYAVTELFWECLPTLSTITAMKMLNHVVPSIASVKGYYAINEFFEKRAKGWSIPRAMLPMLRLAGVMFIAFIVGFDTFLMKLRVVSAIVAQPDLSRRTLVPCIQFLMQVLGIVQLGPFIRKRLFVFIFGGEDGILQQHEIELMNTWNALLARRMYRDLPFCQFLITMLSFCDEDFQSLVLNESPEENSNSADANARVGMEDSACAKGTDDPGSQNSSSSFNGLKHRPKQQDSNDGKDPENPLEEVKSAVCQLDSRLDVLQSSQLEAVDLLKKLHIASLGSLAGRFASNSPKKDSSMRSNVGTSSSASVPITIV